MENKLKIGLGISGGGFRAAAFSLGTLSYLNKVDFQGANLLHNVYMISTVSGGTITGTRYALGLKNDESFDDIYKSIYEFMTKTQIINDSLDILINKGFWSNNYNRNIINSFSEVYDKDLFKRALFGELLNNKETHLKQMCFNACDFSSGLQFRFQETEITTESEGNELKRGIIGNYKNRIPREAAVEIKLADILAASSCFPGGFEPINFPRDFISKDSKNLKELNDCMEQIGLMDGGVVDNQGIESLLLAEARMKKNVYGQGNTKDKPNVFDILTICDVSSPYMEEYKASIDVNTKGLRSLSVGQILNIGIIGLIVSILVLGTGYFMNFRGMIIGGSIALPFFGLLSLARKALLTALRKGKIPQAFRTPVKKLLKINIGIYQNLIENRVNSFLKMNNDVFLKQIRRLQYEKIWKDSSWKNRRIMNAIYELRPDETRLGEKIKSGKLPYYLKPSEMVQCVAKKAASMGTTLWFSESELKDGMIDYIIACGQFTMCWNLLEYIEKIEEIKKTQTDNINLSEGIEDLLKIKEQLKEHWELFKSNPKWMVDLHKQT